MIIEIEDDIGAKYTYDLDENAPLNICSCDVDGTLSPGVFYLDNGRIGRSYNMRDGAGLRNLVRVPNTVVFLISGENDASIWNRSLKLQIPFFHAPGRNKVPKFVKVLQHFSYFDVRVYHIGDDTNDLELLKRSDCPACPQNAQDEVLDYVNGRTGGKVVSSVRQWTDWLRLFIGS